jgi:hypothetical protein
LNTADKINTKFMGLQQRESLFNIEVVVGGDERRG